ncbi:hypothetical protein FRC17_007807, partial [Serendipita sp. 399]
IIFDDLEEIRAFEIRVAQRQQAADVTRTSISEMKKAIKIVENIESVRQSRFENNALAQATLDTITISQQAIPQPGYSVPKLDEVVSSYHQEVERTQRLVQDGRAELVKGRQLLSELKHDLSVMNSRLQEQQRTIDVMIQYSSSLQQEIVRRRHLISAFRRLPREVLEQIFEKYIQDEVAAIRNKPFQSPGRAVLMLSSVCSAWRRIVSETSQLWTYIPLMTPCRPSHYQHRAASMARYVDPKRLLKHAILDCPKGGSWSWFYNWDSTAFTTDPVGFASSHFPGISQAFEQLASIELLGKSARGDLVVECSWPVESYRLSGLFPHFIPASAVVVHKLSLKIRSINWSALAHLFHSLINLKTFSIIVEEEKWDPPLNRDLICSVPSLFHLSSSTVLLPTLLESAISCPGLQQIGISTATNNVDSGPVIIAWNRVSKKLSSAETAISTLNINYSSCKDATAKQIIPLLHLFPSLETIRLEGSFMSPIIEYLIASPQICCGIRRIILVETDDVTDELLRNFIFPNLIPDAHISRAISSITVDHCTSITQAFCDEIKG